MTTQFRRTIRGFTLVSFISTGLCACENTEPVSRIGSCESIVIDAAGRRDGPFETTCDLTDLTKAIWVVALPGEKVATESLSSLGIPSDVALMISQRESLRPEWCTVDEFKPQAPSNDPSKSTSSRFRKTCIGTVMAIRKVAAVRSSRIVITAARAQEGAVNLIDLSAAK